MPTATEIHFHPGGEITGRMRQRQADVADIAVAVARRDVEAAAERDRQMRIVAADAPLLLEDIEGRAGCTRVLIPEGDPIM